MVRQAHGLNWLVLAVALTVLVSVQMHTPAAQAHPEDLGPAPSPMRTELMALGDRTALSRALLIGLQAFDVQPGFSIPYRKLNYAHLRGWLQCIVDLNPRSQYALLMASRLYAEVPDPVRTREMLDFIHQAFLEDPARRWPWLAHAVILARHRLNDPQLALRYAHDLRVYAKGSAVPHWATQMEIFALDDMDQKEAARVLLGGLLASGSITEPHERHFLLERLRALESAGPPKQSEPSDFRH